MSLLGAVVGRLPSKRCLPLAGSRYRTDRRRRKLNASITFLPDDGKKRPAASESVTEGEYRFDRTNGPTAGRTKVLIRRIDGRQHVPRTPQTKTNRKTPTKSEWTRFVNVADDGKYVQDFTLEN